MPPEARTKGRKGETEDRRGDRTERVEKVMNRDLLKEQKKDYTSLWAHTVARLF